MAGMSGMNGKLGEIGRYVIEVNWMRVFAPERTKYRPGMVIYRNPELKHAIDRIAAGDFAEGDATLFQPLVESLLSEDEYLLLADYVSYVACQDRVEEAYRDAEAWTRMSILNAARCGFFSSDRTIDEYATDIWRVPRLPVSL